MAKGLLLTISLACVSISAHAAEIDYSYIDAGYSKVELDDLSGDGARVRGSAAVTDQFYLFGSYTSLSGDQGIDADETLAGLGFRAPVGERADFIAELGHARYEVTVDFAQGSASATDAGGMLSAGFRFGFTDRLEGLVKGSYKRGGDFTGSLSGAAGLSYALHPRWRLYAEVETGELVEDADLTRYGIGVRLAF